MNIQISDFDSKKYIKILGSGLFYLGFPLAYMNFILPVFGKNLGSTPVQIGFFYTAFFVMTMIIRPVVGVITDKIGRKKFIILGFIGYALALICLSLARNFTMVIAARSLQGIASSFFWIVANASIADISTENTRVHNFGTMMQYNSRGQVLGAFIGFAILFTYMGFFGKSVQADGMRFSFAVFGVIVLMAAVKLIFRLPETYSRTKTVTVVQQEKVKFRPKGVWWILLAASFTTAASSILIAPLVILLLQDKFNAPFELVAMVYAPMGIVWAFAPKYMIKFIDRYGKLMVMSANLIASAVSIIFIPYVPTLLVLSIIWAVTALFDIGGNIAEQSLIADLTNNDHYGKGYSLYILINDIGCAVGPLVGTALYMKNAALPFKAASGMCFATGIVVAVAAGKRIGKKN